MLYISAIFLGVDSRRHRSIHYWERVTDFLKLCVEITACAENGKVSLSWPWKRNPAAEFSWFIKRKLSWSSLCHTMEERVPQSVPYKWEVLTRQWHCQACPRDDLVCSCPDRDEFPLSPLAHCPAWMMNGQDTTHLRSFILISFSPISWFYI